MKRTAWALMACLLCAGAVSAAAAEGDGEVSNHIVLSWNEFKEITGWTEQQASGAASGDFTIPWSEVKDLFGIEMDDVQAAELTLPWKEFKALLEWSVREEERKQQELNNEAPVPTPVLITAAEYVGTELTSDGAFFEATLKIDILEKKGWHKIHVLPGNVAVSKADLPEGVYLQLEGNNYYLLTQTNGTIEVGFDFTAQVTESSGTYSMAFNKVPSGTCLIDVTVPEIEVDINIRGAQSKLSKSAGDATRMVAALSAGSAVNISWERAIPEAETVPPKLYTETRTLISVSDGMLLGRSQLAFNVLHAGTRQLQMKVPQGASIYDVRGPSIRDWRVDGGQLMVQFSKEMIGSLSIEVLYEAPIGTEGSALPVITADGVEREKGHIAIVALSNVEISGLETTGATKVDTKDLPPELLGMTTQPVLLGYRYIDPKFDVRLKIDKHPDVDVLLTVVDSAHVQVMQTIDGRRIVKARYNVRNNRNQFLRLKLPEGASLWSASVAGKSTQPAKDDEGRLLLPLVRSQGVGGLSSFPVEITYAEDGTAPDSRGRGDVRVELASCSEPVFHMMVDLYVPEDGRYSDFKGNLREVDSFTPVKGGNDFQYNVAEVQSIQLQNNVNFDMGQQTAPIINVPAATADAVKVQLPITGENYKFEKILVLDEDPWFSYSFSGLK